MERRVPLHAALPAVIFGGNVLGRLLPYFVPDANVRHSDLPTGALTLMSCLMESAKPALLGLTLWSKASMGSLGQASMMDSLYPLPTTKGNREGSGDKNFSVDKDMEGESDPPTKASKKH